MFVIREIKYDRNRGFKTSNNKIIISGEPKIIYDCYGNLYKTIDTPGSHLYSYGLIYNNYYIYNGNDSKIHVINLESLDSALYTIEENYITLQFPYCWVEANSSTYNKVNIVTKIIVETVNLPETIYSIIPIGKMTYFAAIAANNINLYFNDHKRHYDNVIMTKCNKKYLILLCLNWIHIYNCYGQVKTYKTIKMEPRDWIINEHYMFIYSTTEIIIFNFKLQILYKMEKLPSSYFAVLNKFIIIDENIGTICRLRPDCIIRLKAKIQNTSYWNILRLI